MTELDRREIDRDLQDFTDALVTHNSQNLDVGDNVTTQETAGGGG